MSKSSLKTLGLLIKLIVLVLSLAYIGEKTATLDTLTFTVGSAWHNVMIVFAFWAELLRPGFALCALWAAANVFARVGEGDAFGPAMIKGMRGTGLNLIMGAIGALVLVPLFDYLAEGQLPPLVYGTNIESLAFGLIGLVIYVLARQGLALKSELAQYV